MSSSQATSSDAPLFNGITSQELAALLQNDGRQTPLFFQQEFLDDTMSPWNTSDIDWSSVYQDIAAAAPGLRALIAQMEHDVHGDTIQDIVAPPSVQGSTSSEVVASVNLNEFIIFGPFPVEGRDYPVYVAAYTHYLPEPFLAAGAASGGAIARLTVSTLARRIAADARRSNNCSLFHLCPICEEMLTRKSTLKGQFPLAHELRAC
ncbi:hypothetical protein EV715DRAFT_276359 [Schizophyllum commune]